MTTNPSFEDASCPVPLAHNDRIVIGHGSGGKMTHDLIRKVFLPYFDNPILKTGDDSAIISFSTGSKFAITTDSHVVDPLFFPGGDIGRLAICGTVNDLAVMGAAPLYLTAGFIIEEGFDISLLHSILLSMRRSAIEAGVSIVAGDTKVVQRGKCDKLFINTSGFGIIHDNISISGANAKPGDMVIVSGSIGNHGIAVLAARGELGFDTNLTSDVAPLNHLVKSILDISTKIHVMRDPTRGGLATTLNEIALQSNVSIHLEEKNIPVLPAVRATCEMLGFDPLYIANEGKLVIIADPADAHKILAALQNHPYGRDAAIIGKIVNQPAGHVLVRTEFGSSRLVDMLAGEILPRIC